MRSPPAKASAPAHPEGKLESVASFNPKVHIASQGHSGEFISQQRQAVFVLLKEALLMFDCDFVDNLVKALAAGKIGHCNLDFCRP